MRFQVEEIQTGVRAITKDLTCCVPKITNKKAVILDIVH